MNVIKIAGLLLLAFLSIGLQAMELPFAQEKRLIEGSLSVDAYFSSLGGRFTGMVHALRAADYSQSLDGNYYEHLVDEINNMVDSMRRNQMSEVLLRALKLKVRRFVGFYYNELKDAKERGFVKEGRVT